MPSPEQERLSAIEARLARIEEEQRQRGPERSPQTFRSPACPNERLGRWPVATQHSCIAHGFPRPRSCLPTTAPVLHRCLLPVRGTRHGGVRETGARAGNKAWVRQKFPVEPAAGLPHKVP